MKRKLTQVLMVFVLLGQIIAPSIHCIVQASEQLPVYVVKASQKKEINKAKLSTVLKNSTISDATYTVSEPVALFTMVADKLVEDAYFPIIVQKKIAALIRYNSETDKFVLEKETVVKEITSKYLETTSQSPLVLVCVSGEILGKNRTGYYNFSNPEMVEEEVKPLFSQVDLSAVNLEDAQNIYDVPKADVTDDASHEIPGPDIKASESTDKVSNTDKSASKDKVDKQNKVYKTDDGLKDTRLKAGPFVENPQQYQKIAPILPRIFDTGYGPAKKDYTKGLISETDYVARSNYGSLNKKDLYFLIKSKDGQYAYSKLFIMRWHWKIPVSQLKIDRFYFEQLGGDKGNASLVDDQKNLIQFYFKPEFYTYYASYSSKNQNPYQGKSLNDLLNWLNFWTDNEISIVQMSSYEIEHDVLRRNTGVEYKPAKVDYTKEISNKDYNLEDNYVSLNRSDLYFLIKYKDGQYAYSKILTMRWHWKIPVSQLKIDRFYFEQLGGDKGNASLVDDQKNWIQLHLKPEFYTYYASYSSTYKNPYQGKSLNDLLNWFHFWTDNEISIVQMSSYEIEHDVLRRNTGVEYKPAKVDYTKEITNKDYNLEDNYVSLNRSDLYFLIKSKDGQYAYSKLLTMRWHWKIPASQLKFDRFYFEQLGGDKGNASLVDDQKNWIQFHLKPEFYTYYASYSSTYKNPYQGKSLNDLLNWFHFWTDNEISIVQESTIALFTAQKNKEIKEWQFIKEGRTSSKDQFYRFSLNQTTRLNISAYGAPYQKLTVYNKQKQKYFEMNYYSFYGFSDILDLPAGDYYIQLTNVQNKTIFQMTKSLFLDQQLSVETSPEKTDVYLNHQFNPQLTALYKPYHQKSDNNTAINVLNQLTDVWYFSYQHYEVLDNLFGNDHKVRLPSLRQITVQNLGFQPLGNDLRKKSMQYIGRNTFYANNTMFQTRFTPQQRIIGVDDLAYLAIGVAAVALYSAYLVSQTPTSSAISLNIPMFQEPTFGSWPVEKRFEFDGTLDYKVKTYGVNEDTGEIRDIDSGVDLPEEIISRAFRAEIPKVRTQAIAQALIGAEVEIPRNYKWYTVKDLIEDETRDWQSAGGHTIAKHISKSDDYLKNRAKTGTMAIASSYDTVLQALIAINFAKITNIFRFTTVSTKQVFSVNTGTIPLGKGFDKEGTCYNYMTRAAIVILPDHSQKGFRVQTSYPTR
ncbi:RNase A-like domain-containing protein [Lactococcus paracarnosus]|uniref:Bacterial CdiA-CT RNAse A domain-containing protein n=1 Tax=Pseudolactococcus paracarnosus TaxID=2749962 RepID=A0ABT0AM98_9LACT|nr:RNase A-like domain-containing protein [Lactococcus paracarnosus]MCJ1977628.1 hypothetical protein [Lactococcus paracarnosus]MCJ1983771.1 hypothetical protein [Lactococcus paracarnosus]MCJ1998794.1 hypothetical protein [Lactococcus paracarnosus]